MRRVFDEIATCEAAFARRPFFRMLEGTGSIDDVRAIARGMTFFILAFQDVLRLVEARTRDPELRALAAQHRREDTGHERWFLRDLQTLGEDVGLSWLFGAEHEITRDAAYSVVAEVLHAQDDEVMLAVCMAMESAGEVFLERCQFFEGENGTRELLFFSRRHRDAERQHAIDEEPQQASLHAIALTSSQWEAARGAVRRTFEAMDRMCAGIMASLPWRSSGAKPVLYG